jgi:hemerythrin
MLIVWRDQMSVDGGLIDQDHRVLIGIINDFAATDATPAAVPALEGILAKLDRYTQIHFEREEKLQRAILYPYHEAHRRSHKDLIRQLSEVRAELTAKPVTTKPDDLIAAHAKMGEFLHHWLVDHIIETDLRMKPYTAEIRAHAHKLSKTLGE